MSGYHVKGNTDGGKGAKAQKRIVPTRIPRVYSLLLYNRAPEFPPLLSHIKKLPDNDKKKDKNSKQGGYKSPNSSSSRKKFFHQLRFVSEKSVIERRVLNQMSDLPLAILLLTEEPHLVAQLDSLTATSESPACHERAHRFGQTLPRKRKNAGEKKGGINVIANVAENKYKKRVKG